MSPTSLCKCWKYITSPWETISVWIGPYTGFTLMSKSCPNTYIECWRPCSWTEWLMQNTSVLALCMSLFISDLSSSPLGFGKTESGAFACCWGKGEPSGLQQMLFTPSTAASHIDSMQKVHGSNYIRGRNSAMLHLHRLWSPEVLCVGYLKINTFHIYSLLCHTSFIIIKVFFFHKVL